MTNTNTPNFEKLAKILEQSSLTIGEYSPSEQFLKKRSIAISVNKKPIILLGYLDDNKTNEIADSLLESPNIQRKLLSESQL